MDSHPSSTVAPESSGDVAHDTHWVPLAIPLAVAMILAAAGLVCLWSDAFI